MDIRISTLRPMSCGPPARNVQVMSTATRDHPSGSLRVSDADRDRAIAELSEHYQAGRLTTEEFEDRTGRALQARTAADLDRAIAELASLFTDLPRRQAPVTSAAASAPASSAPSWPARSWPARVPVAPFAVLAVVVALAVFSGHPHIAWVPVLVLIVVRLLVGGRGRRFPR
jgi:hypothetical protein